MNDFATHLDNYVPGKLSEMKLPGCAVGLIENGELSQTRCYGYANVADQIPLTETTLFQIASISKAVAAWGIMKLVENGSLDLDAPVDTYLSRWHLPASDYDSDQVTARRLLMHFAGTSMSGCGGCRYGTRDYVIEDILNGKMPPLDASQTAYVKKWGMDPQSYVTPVHLMHAPDEKFEYSGGGFTILELIIEEISGQDFTSFMNDQILNPLGMRDSTFEIQDSQFDQCATGYDDELEPMALYRINGKAAGGMYSNIQELCRFACAEMEGPHGEAPGRGVVSPESIAEMHRPDRFAEEEMGIRFYTGLGHYVVDLGGVRAVQHTGGNPGWRTVYTIVPEKKLGFVCLINSAGGNDLWMDLIMQWSATFMD